MDTYAFIIAIVAIVMGAGIIRSMLAKGKGGTKHLDARIQELGLEEKIAQLDDLEERITVLERIATSKNSGLADKIDDL